MSDTRSDAEVICEWMQQFYRGTGIWYPPLTLDALREVEERLTEEQRKCYVAWFYFPPPLWEAWALLHSSAEQKIKALAAVLRAEKRDGRER